MSGSVKIGVGAELSESDFQAVARGIERQFNAMGQTVAKASKLKFEPVSIKTRKDLDDFHKRMESLLRIQTELSRRAKSTGQEALDPLSYNYNKLYTNQSTRIRKMQEVVQYLGGEFSGKDAKRPAWQQIGLGATQAGLRAASGATGGVGGVAANALGTGMSAGFGAGLMGLMGGMLALGVGKLVSAATEKIGQAEDNAVAYDRMKRSLGDVNVSFRTLKSAIEGAASNVKITFEESAKLSQEFVRRGNLKGSQSGELEGELRTGVGMSRSLGIDPSQGMGFLGTMRGMRMTRDVQDSRRMALLIGETIAKSDAFAKSDEVMEAISNYVTTQTRASHGANVAGFAGMFSAMVGSGVAGMDPSGAAGILGRINSSLMQGGSAGEASQFFTAMVGKRLGLDPLQTQLLREAGAFATPDQVFGKGSVYHSATGEIGPGGKTSMFDATNSLLAQQYGGTGRDSKLMRAHAASRHYGISMTNALALSTMQGNQMGELEAQLAKSGLKVSDVNFGGLTALSKVITGTGQDRMGVASELWSRTGKGRLTDPERAQLDKVMKEGTEAEQKELLTQLVASRDQEMTQGKDIRDSKTAIENIKTLMAEQLLPVTQSMRDGIMWMAGGKDGKSEQTIREDMAKADIKEKFDRKIKKLEDDAKQAQKDFRDGVGPGTYADRYKRSFDAQVEAQGEIARLKEQQRMEIEAKLREMRTDPAPTQYGPEPSAPSGWRAPGGAHRGASGSSANLGEIEGKLAAADAKNGLPPGTMKAILMQEVGGRASEFLSDPSKYHYGLDANGRRVAPHTGKISTAFGPFGILESTAANPGYGVAPLKDKSIDEQIRFASEYAAARIRSAGSFRGGLAGYGEGGRYADRVLSRMGTPMPEDASASWRKDRDHMLSFKGSFDPLSITIQSPDGRHLSQPQYLNPYFTIPQFGRPS